MQHAATRALLAKWAAAKAQHTELDEGTDGPGGLQLACAVRRHQHFPFSLQFSLVFHKDLKNKFLVIVLLVYMCRHSLFELPIPDRYREVPN